LVAFARRAIEVSLADRATAEAGARRVFSWPDGTILTLVTRDQLDSYQTASQYGDLIIAVGNPAPHFFGDVRMGKNLYTAAMVVLDAKSGKLQWFRQFVPHDQHDWDLTVTNPL
jgi:glucose dehydrogenase